MTTYKHFQCGTVQHAIVAGKPRVTATGRCLFPVPQRMHAEYTMCAVQLARALGTRP